ncbi:MAG: hypothetical protein ACLP0J_08955 [Solirubrobacteraceae bacterium]
MDADEQRLIGEIRERLERELASLTAPSDTLARLRVRASAGEARRGGARRFVLAVRPVGVSWVLIALGCAIALAVGGLAIVSLHTHQSATTSGPTLAPTHKRQQTNGAWQRPAREMGYIRTALNTVMRTDPACRFGAGLRAGATSVSQGAPSARMLALLAVLRRPATAADRLPRTRFYINGRLNLFLPVGEVYVRYIRLATVADGIAFYLIPVGKDGPPAPARATLDRCYAQQIATLRGKLTGVPASLRASTMRDGERFFAESRTNVANRRVHESVYELEAAQNGSGASDAGSAAAIQLGGPLGGLGSQSPQKTVIMSGVVPDGVATVTLHYAAGGSGAHHLPPLIVTSTVVRNVFAMAIPDFGDTRNWPSTMVWRSRTGALIKTIDERPLSP